MAGSGCPGTNAAAAASLLQNRNETNWRDMNVRIQTTGVVLGPNVSCGRPPQCIPFVSSVRLNSKA
ncbi:hypothetical protein BAXH7_01620 [Bacillus amyloliquefaciens XH7]|nr:hypothetical protein BAXH7_01620 [Bacillus amyloliquefaciens XH7]KYC99664.1 hypothetical protein B425_1993 [Bacillus amyloliquefaciens]